MKHAYLIMAHTQLEQLKKLVKFLDYDGNDVYVHIDKNARNILIAHLSERDL